MNLDIREYSLLINQNGKSNKYYLAIKLKSSEVIGFNGSINRSMSGYIYNTSFSKKSTSKINKIDSKIGVHLKESSSKNFYDLVDSKKKKGYHEISLTSSNLESMLRKYLPMTKVNKIIELIELPNYFDENQINEEPVIKKEKEKPKIHKKIKKEDLIGLNTEEIEIEFM